MKIWRVPHFLKRNLGVVYQGGNLFKKKGVLLKDNQEFATIFRPPSHRYTLVLIDYSQKEACEHVGSLNMH